MTASAACVVPVMLAAAYRTGPPPGYSGGFGEDSCHYCHYEFEPTEDPAAFAVTGFPETYLPGERYILEVSVSAERLGAAGFQLAVRFADGAAAGHNAGSLESMGERTSVDVSEKNGVAYARQTLEGITPQEAGRAAWRVTWTAPADGRVRLDAAANAGDGDESQMGDRVYTLSLEAAPTALRP